MGEKFPGKISFLGRATNQGQIRLQILDIASMAQSLQSEEIAKEGSPNILATFNITFNIIALLFPEVFLEGDAFGCMLMQACLYMGVGLKTSLFLCVGTASL